MGGKKTSTLREYLEALLIAGAFLGFSNTFVVKTFYIPSASMETTLLVGDHLFVNRFIYGESATALGRALLPSRDVRRGDVVIFRSPEEPTMDMVKRCVGLPGDVVEMDAKDLYINGEWVDDSSYTRHTEPRVVPRRDTFGPQKVPEDHYFCLGDNRDNSHDSRYWGAVPREFVKGRAVLVYWSMETGGPVRRAGGSTWWQAPVEELGPLLSRTRWERTFRLVR